MGAHKMAKGSEQVQLSLFSVEDGEGKTGAEVPEKAFRLVGDEVLAEKLDPECWAKALAGGGRTKASALSMYAKLRSEELSEGADWKAAKAKALEDRKISAAKATTKSSARVAWDRRFSLMWDFLFWQVLLSVSGVGIYLGLLMMGGSASWWPGWISVLGVSACLQVSPVFIHGVGRLLFTNSRYHHALGVTAVLLIALGALFSVQTFRGGSIPTVSMKDIEKLFEKRQPAAAAAGATSTGEMVEF